MQLSRVTRFAALGVMLAAVTNSLWASTARVVGAIDSSKVTAVAGSVSPRVAVTKVLGRVAGNRKLGLMTLRFAMTDAQQKALTQLLADQQNPASTRYHQWLTPEQFGVEFGLSAEDLGKVSAWLTAQGFVVTKVARGGGYLRFSGTVAQAEQAFHTEIHNVSLNGEQHVANVTAVKLPAAIAAVASGLGGLDDFHPKPWHQQMLLPGGTGSVTPLYTTTAGAHQMAPADFYTIYDVGNLISSSVTGSGVTIAVVGQADISLSDVAAFRTAAGLANNVPTVTLYGNDPGSSVAGDVIEAEMDVEWAGAVAPGASISYLNSMDAIDDSLTEAIDGNVAPIVATSYGACEADLGTSTLAYYNQLLQMASAQGMTVTAASGDEGATDCDGNVGSAVGGLAVDFPASSPQVTGVGGTQLNEGGGTYWNASNGPSGGSALSYIPEVVWNADNGAGLDASGGGESDYFAKPAWQVGTGVPADFSRDVPDVALSASITHDGYLICVGSDCTNGFANASGGMDVAGGTSIGAPTFAGLLALVEQKAGARLGNVNPAIYALANSTYVGNVFHDVTSGTNASPCTTGSVDCPVGGTIGFAAGAGYDLATGWGSVDAYNLVNDWALVTAAPMTGGVVPTVTTLAGSAISVTAGSSIVFTTTVAAGSATSTATPTGTVEITVDEIGIGSAPLTSGVGTYTLSAAFTSSLSVGSHTVQATYLGDSTFAGSKAAFAINVAASGAPNFTLTPSTISVMVASGGIAAPVMFTLNSLNGFVGNVMFAASVTGPALNAQYSFTINPVVLNSTVTSATTSLTLLAYTNNASLEKQRPAGWYGAGSGVVLAGLVLLMVPRRRRILGLLVAVVSLVGIGLMGCQSASPVAAATTTGTAVGTYQVLVSATGVDGGMTTTKTSTVTFVVQ
jgi:subtilase family serine protease